MRTDFDRAHVTARGRVAILTFNHPEAMNAASGRLVAGAREALRFVASDSSFRCLVVTGEGRGFCSGANLADRADGVAPEPRESLQTIFHPFLRQLRDFEMPIVTAVNGAAAGVGMSIALMGDLVIAARSAYFLQAFAKVGLVPDGGSTWLLPRLIGLARARELSLLAERLPAETALAWGLINRVSDEAALLPDALALAERLANGPTIALNLTRALYFASPHNGYETQLDLESRMQGEAGRTQDFGEGVRAFAAKRAAVFQGR